MFTVDDLGDDYPTFPQFQRALRAYEQGFGPAPQVTHGEVMRVEGPIRIEAPLPRRFVAPVGTWRCRWCGGTAAEHHFSTEDNGWTHANHLVCARTGRVAQ